jgi:FtsZ-binding cell division protein ZapB
MSLVIFMTERQESVLNELKFKVERLIKQYRSSLERNQIQEGNIKALSLEIEALKNENKSLSEELKTAKIANAISGGNNSGSYQAKMRINQLVREIDKCIALLNN